MPIFRINDQLHYFAHVPKCGGSSIEFYLTERFGPIAMTEPRRHRISQHLLWTRSAAQHVPLFALDELFPAGWFASSFAVVRHPVRRLISAFFYARDVLATAPLTTEFNAWFQAEVGRIDTHPFATGHLLPQTSLVPQNARIFRLEDGLEAVIPHLDQLAGDTAGPRVMPTKNVGRWRGEEAEPVLTPETLAIVARVYARDFPRFGYPLPETPAIAAGLPDLPSLATTGRPPAPRPRRLMARLKRAIRKQAGQ